MMEKAGIKVPRDEDDITLFLLLGVLDADKVCCKECAAILALGWRCLYAEIVRCRIDELWDELDLKRALRRAVAMVISRVTAYGERWRRHYLRTRNTTRAKKVAKKHQQHKLIKVSEDAKYELDESLTDLQEELKRDDAQTSDTERS